MSVCEYLEEFVVLDMKKRERERERKGVDRGLTEESVFYSSFYFHSPLSMSLFLLLFFPGQFTLRDMYEQFQNIMKMGPFSQIMVRETLTTAGKV